jgi:WD40 repeat protein
LQNGIDVPRHYRSKTLYGHYNSCNSVAFNKEGTMIASTDADGVVKLWDIRMVAEIMTIDAGKHPANKCSFDMSGQILAVASDDGRIKTYNTSNGEAVNELTGHEDAVQAVIFDPAGQYMVSCGSDNTFRLWS